MEEAAERQLFKIGAVARLTGVSVHTLRKWEARHGAVRPRRSEGGKRLYTDADVQRLVLIKKLVDNGLSLHSIADCSFDELADRWARLTRAELPPPAIGPTRIAVLGTGVAAWLKPEQGQPTGVEVVAAADDAEELEQRVRESAVDVLVVECPAVSRSTSQEVGDVTRALDVPSAVVVYWFGNERHVKALQSRHIGILRAPADAAELQQVIARLRGAGALRPASLNATRPVAPEPVAPRFTRESLARMAAAEPKASCGCQKKL